MIEERNHPPRETLRFEPPHLDAKIIYPDHMIMRAQILDISRGGITLALPMSVEDLRIGDKVNVTALKGDSETEIIELGKARAKRAWRNTAWLSETRGKGIALQFETKLPNDDSVKDIFEGAEQEKRLAAQNKMASMDAAALGQYRRNLFECQMKLFIVNLTIGVALAGAYFALTYNAIINDKTVTGDLTFWRSMVAALPGLLAITCALMVAQKNISIQRIDAYLSVIKESSIFGQYPREYRGWEVDSKKLRYILGRKRCHEVCKLERKCVVPTAKHPELESRKLFQNPMNDPYYFLMYSTFLVVVILSLCALVSSMLHAKWTSGWYMTVAVALTIVLTLPTAGLIYVFTQLRKGRYSFEAYRHCWFDLLTRCRQTI